MATQRAPLAPLAPQLRGDMANHAAHCRRRRLAGDTHPDCFIHNDHESESPQQLDGYVAAQGLGSAATEGAGGFKMN